MSDQTPEAVELPRGDDAAFSALMDVLAPEDAGKEADAAAPAAGAPAGADGGSAGAADGDGAAAAPAVPGDGAGAGAPAGAGAGPGGAGDGTGGVVPGADPAAAAGAPAVGGGSDLPAAWTADAASLAPKLAELSTALETKVEQTYQAAALEEARTEYAAYFEALEQHPRLMVGMEVPAVGPGKTGNEVLRDAKDAEEWQSAVKHLLVQDVRARASRAMDEQGDFLQTVHASIELFQKNPDLMPTTKGFDRVLADRFTKLVEPYEIKVDEKLQGYSIPVQPIIDQLRASLVAERAAGALSPAAAVGGKTDSPAGATPAATPKPPADPPQAGIQSKAGSGADPAEDFSALFGTIGLPNLRI